MDDDGYGQDVGRRIKRARLEVGGTGMTQRELADLLQVSERSVAAYEAGEVVPYRFMKELGEYLNVSPVYLLHGDDARESELTAILDELRQLRSDVGELRKTIEWRG